MDAEDWNERYAASELMWSAGPNQFVEEYGTGLVPGRALDLACGEGRNAIWLARRGWRVTASDFSQVALDKGARIVDAEQLSIVWTCSDAITDQHDPLGYDLVIICYLQLPPDPLAAALDRAAAAVAHGGRFFLVNHALENLHSGVGGPQDPAVLQTPEQLRTIIESTGLTIERCSLVERQVTDADAMRTAIDVIVTAHREPPR